MTPAAARIAAERAAWRAEIQIRRDAAEAGRARRIASRACRRADAVVRSSPGESSPTKQEHES